MLAKVGPALTRQHYIAHPIRVGGTLAGHLAHTIDPDGREIGELHFMQPDEPKKAAESIGLQFTIESRDSAAVCEYCRQKGR